METVIAKLLNDFENGRMTRRQLIQSLALAAVAAPAASAVAQGAQGASAPIGKTVWLDHISFQVADYKKSVAFYTDLMGWKVRNGSDNGRQATLDIGDVGGIIIRNGRRPSAGAENPGATSDSARAAQSQANRAPITGVIDHISWGIEPWDNEKVRAGLEARGLTPLVDTGGGGDIATSKFKSYHVRDPDGWDLQISNQTKEHHDG